MDWKLFSAEAFQNKIDHFFLGMFFMYTIPCFFFTRVIKNSEFYFGTLLRVEFFLGRYCPKRFPVPHSIGEIC